jgi:hypothetical protein
MMPVLKGVDELRRGRELANLKMRQCENGGRARRLLIEEMQNEK